ncbi:Hypothetical protein R9X50_00566100 [Acrodontium crateriforme]|uniref:Uncharacterized protein n=1 Tax=Acrodontium crateriforme TaxID=150365 RepID=A0AAQ3M8C5_9PEZI|nr:Hypothetical protein R9X50_00566100 [Acrodontium crateriforme]
MANIADADGGQSLASQITDFIPIPANTGVTADPLNADQTHTMAEKATDSHALAVADHDEKGFAQEAHGNEVKDLGWQEENIANIPSPLVGGLPNEELWLLIRRFNKQMYHVKAYPHPVAGNLDLNIADEEEFSPDKLRANVERLYMTVGIGLFGFFKQIVRLRSWHESRRTAAFASAYFIAWLLDFLVPLFSIFLIILIVYPPSRDLLFPPAPIALVSAKTGGLQKPKAGVLGSTDSATGAPESHKGEAVEAEASNFVNGIASIALSSASGKHPQQDQSIEGADADSDSVPDPTAFAVSASNARVTTQGAKKSEHHDKTKVPMETAMWNTMRPAMHGLADVADTWERFANALSPTPPFPQDVARLRLAGVIVPLLAISLVTTSYAFCKTTTFGIGFGFFGDPIIQRGLAWLNRKFPHWEKILELRNTLLKGVPTNAQLTITVLRIGEANKAPIPPPPFSHAPPPNESVELTPEDLHALGADSPLNATDAEIAAAIAPTETSAKSSAIDIDKSSHPQPQAKKSSKLIGLLKKGVKGTISTALGADHIKASAGSSAAKNRLGVVPSKTEDFISGPIDFKCRYQGKKGYAYIATRATIPCVAFSRDSGIAKEGTSGKEDEELNPVWSIAIGDIREVKKVGGLGWKSKLVVGWALDCEVADGLEIIDKEGKSHVVTAMLLRDELFNRLVSMGGQKWESW